MDVSVAYAGLVAATVAVIDFLKNRFKWVDGKEAYLSFGLPVLLSVAAKASGCTAEFAQMPWGKMVVGALVAGAVAQFGHDKVWDPVVKPLLVKVPFLGSLVNKLFGK